MEDDTEQAGPKKDSRDTELSKRERIKEQAIKIADMADKAFQGEDERGEQIHDYWDAFNCKLSDRQFYHGTSAICTPFVHDAVMARQTRFSGQLFPENQKHIEAVGGDHIPYATISLLEHYLRRSKFKTNVVDPMFINGDIEGQYNLYVSWEARTRHVTAKVLKPITVDDLETDETVEDMTEDEEIVDFGPSFEVLSDTDVRIFPATASSIEHALEIGGGCAIMRRWTKGEIRRLQAAKEIDNQVAEALISSMTSTVKRPGEVDASKEQAEAAGVKLYRGAKVAAVIEIWAKLKLGKDRLTCKILYAGSGMFLSIKRNPYWCDRVPLYSCAVDKTSGVFKGKSQVSPVLDFHILANDTVNEAADSGHFSMLPIILTDPLKNPKIATMVLAPAAVWEADPQSTKFAEFPDMWRTGSERIMELRSQIFQTLSVNPSMIPGTTGKNRKMNQAEIAQEQQVDIMTTADAVTVIEEGILTPVLTFMLELDHQFRDEAITVKAFGPVGRKVIMETIEPLQIDRAVSFRWYGVEAAKNAAKMQQQIAFLNVLRGIPPQQYPGYKLNLAPAIERQMEELFGPVVAPQIFSVEDVIGVDPQTENIMMEHGFDTPIHPGDDDLQHLQVHMQALQQTGDPHGTVRKHIMLHQAAAQEKAAKQAMAQQPQQGGGGPTTQGPTPGGQPGMPQSQPGAPGQIPRDQLNRAGAPGFGKAA